MSKINSDNLHFITVSKNVPHTLRLTKYYSINDTLTTIFRNIKILEDAGFKEPYKVIYRLPIEAFGMLNNKLETIIMQVN